MLLKVDNLGLVSKDGNNLLKNIGFELRSGEILGVAGVSGNGQTELLEVLAGMKTPDAGSVEILDKTVSAENPANPAQIRSLGVAHIPEDRHHLGLVLNFEARENSILGYHDNRSFSTGLLMDGNAIHHHCQTLMKEHDVRPDNPGLYARNFSGGNQQKLVIAREVDPNPRVFLVGQPTRGVDIGAIEFIHKALIALRDQGCAILLVSVELEEVLGLSDRIMVMNAGRSVGILERKDADEETLGLMMAGIESEKAA